LSIISSKADRNGSLCLLGKISSVEKGLPTKYQQSFFSLFFNTLSDRLVRHGSAFFVVVKFLESPLFGQSSVSWMDSAGHWVTQAQHSIHSSGWTGFDLSSSIL
jgi:hypothetical protein